MVGQDGFITTEELTCQNDSTKTIVLASRTSSSVNNYYQWSSQSRTWSKLVSTIESARCMWGMFEINNICYLVVDQGIMKVSDNLELHKYPSNQEYKSGVRSYKSVSLETVYLSFVTNVRGEYSI